MRRRRSLLLASALAAAPTLSARGADPQPYTVTLAKTGDGTIDAALAASATLLTLRKSAPAGPFALVGRARNDVATLQTVLGGFGYYAATVTVTIDGTPISDPALPDHIAELPKTQSAAIAIAVARGPLFHLRKVTVEGALDPAARAAFGLHPGRPRGRQQGAVGRRRDAGRAGRERLRLRRGQPAHRLRGTRRRRRSTSLYKVDEGPRVDLGPITLAGLRSVHASYIARRLQVHQGQLYQGSRIEAARQDLASTGVFSTVQATTAKTPNAAGEVPVTFSFVESPPRTVAFTASYSTDLGGAAGVSWTHHNFFGNAEQLELAALATGLGGTAAEGLGYDVYAQLTKPDLWALNQTGHIRVEALKQNLTTYNETAELIEAGLARKLGRSWTLGADIRGEEEQVRQEGVTRDYTLLQLPLTASFDSTHLANPLDDPTSGVRINLGVTPSESLGSGNDIAQDGTRAGDSFFTILQASASTYLDFHHLGLSRPGKSVLAVRGVVASVQGASTFALPPDQRLYAGGSNTIRGYKYEQVSPLFPDNRPIGGTSLDAIQVEFRQRIVGNIGAALFADAGQVGTDSAPFHGPLRLGVGVGLRYYTSIGPIRLDVGLPVDKIPGDDSFELYIGLGEAF